MGVQPRVDYERTFVMGNAVLPKLRKLIGSDALCWDDRELGNILDMAVQQQINAGHVEEWWEDDFAFGICLNRVIRVDELIPAGYNYNIPPLYAIVRRAGRDDADIVISIADQEQYDKSIMDRRWTEKRPEKSKYRHPGEPEEAELPPEPKETPVPSAEPTPNGVVTPIDDPPILIVYYVYSDEPKSAHTLTARCKQSEMEKIILGLLNEGVLPVNIEVWHNVSHIQIGISLKPY